MREVGLRGLACAVALCAAAAAQAAHPLISEDTGTQGAGHSELELGTAFAHVDGGHVTEVDPQFSYGPRDDLDFIVRPSWLRLSGPPAEDAGRHTGFGASAVDVKWRIARRDAWSVGARFGADLPTATRGFGARHTGWHGLAMVTYDAPGTLATANVAYTRVAADDADVRRDVWRISAACVRNVHDDVRLLIDAATFQPPERSRDAWHAVALVGAIIRLPPGVDVDVGYQVHLNHAAPASVWLAGMTLRW